MCLWVLVDDLASRPSCGHVCCLVLVWFLGRVVGVSLGFASFVSPRLTTYVLQYVLLIWRPKILAFIQCHIHICYKVKV